MAKITDDFPHGQQLIDAGFTTTAKVQKASDEDLLAIEGIGPAGLVSIRAASEPDEVEDTLAEAAVVTHRCSNPTCGHEISVSPCPYCGAA